MSLPKIDIIFKSKAQSMMQRGERGIVALLLKDKKDEVYEMKSVTDIPTALSPENTKHIEHAFQGGRTAPKKVYAATYLEDLAEGLKVLETLKFQYGAVPGITEEETSKIATWTKECIDEKDLTFQMILPNVEGDHQAIINFTTDKIVLKNGEESTTSEFTARIAGLLAGTPLTQSATYAVLNDVESVERLGIDEADAKVANGEFILINDNEKVKVGRAVTSLTTIDESVSKQFKKILIVQKTFMWKDDVKSVISDNYVGKFSNSYDEKCLLLTDIRLYNKQLEKEGILDNSMVHYNDVYIDLEAQLDFLEEIGTDTEGFGEDDIKKANTEDKVFLATNLKFTDAMEDFKISASI